MSLRKSLIEGLKPLGVEDRPWPGRADGFSSLCFEGKEFAHFHSDNELDIRLTKRLIDREGLAHPPNSTVHPQRSPTSHWIELRFATDEDVQRVIHLARLTIETLRSKRPARG